MASINSTRLAYLTGLLPRSGTLYGSPNSMPHLKNSLSFTFIGFTPVFITINWPFGMDFSSSGVMRGRSIICRDWLGSFFPRLTEPERAVLLPPPPHDHSFSPAVPAIG